MAQDLSSLEHRLEIAPLFAGIPAELRHRFAEESRLLRVKAGELLWREGDEAASFVVIQHGLVLIRRFAPGGEPALLGIFGPREAIGISAVLERGRFPAEALALSDEVVALLVRAGPVLAALPREPALANAINGVLLSHTRALRTKIDVMSAGSVPRRMAALLLHLADRFGDEDERGLLDIPVAISRTGLARLVGARPETVMRTLGKWRREGWLETHAGGFRVRDRARLAGVLGDSG